MNRIGTIAALAGAIALLALGTACFETSVESEDLGDDPRSISVNGNGEARAEPDIATMTLGVETHGATVAAARADAARAADAVIAALRDGGVAEADIRTTYFSIGAVYDYSGERPVIDGYSVSNTVTVTVRDIDATGALIDAAAAAGGDATRFNGISFGYDDPAEYTRVARELAVEDARGKAEQLAELTGVTLGEPLTINETSWAAPVSVRVTGEAVAFADADSAGTSISPGASGISVTVNVVWAIE